MRRRNADVTPNRRFLISFVSIALHIIPGLGDDPSKTSKDSGTDHPSKSTGKTGGEVLLICLGLAAALAFAFLMFRLWQKKKREEQHARLLKLFEEDDELELELGLRD
ncbi:hypothetical protein AXF42_Ash000484 [Apostasia shenzhenica]|uniref:Uncharacterized protein n=1 Tax=Apostasia shenzhenica TaxID=1088818 RepID=A0A2I0AGF1_9ASPA|nr:hypothetical protein AXF42_Ash000484 [Apostasia shenzhenica]